MRPCVRPLALASSASLFVARTEHLRRSIPPNCTGPYRARIAASASSSTRFHDRTVTHCGRICIGKQKVNLSQVFAGQNVGIKEVSDKIWLVTFMHYDLGFFDHETCRLETVDNPFEPKVLPMYPV